VHGASKEASFGQAVVGHHSTCTENCIFDAFQGAEKDQLLSRGPAGTVGKEGVAVVFIALLTIRAGEKLNLYGNFDKEGVGRHCPTRKVKEVTQFLPPRSA
jgi:hypothetical protein